MDVNLHTAQPGNASAISDAVGQEPGSVNMVGAGNAPTIRSRSEATRLQEFNGLQRSTRPQSWQPPAAGNGSPKTQLKDLPSELITKIAERMSPDDALRMLEATEGDTHIFVSIKDRLPFILRTAAANSTKPDELLNLLPTVQQCRRYIDPAKLESMIQAMVDKAVSTTISQAREAANRSALSPVDGFKDAIRDLYERSGDQFLTTRRSVCRAFDGMSLSERLDCLQAGADYDVDHGRFADHDANSRRRRDGAQLQQPLEIAGRPQPPCPGGLQTPNSSTSNTSVAFGGITPPAPRAP